jgi:hypothetical protein
VHPRRQRQECCDIPYCVPKQISAVEGGPQAAPPKTKPQGETVAVKANASQLQAPMMDAMARRETEVCELSERGDKVVELGVVNASLRSPPGRAKGQVRSRMPDKSDAAPVWVRGRGEAVGDLRRELRGRCGG